MQLLQGQNTQRQLTCGLECDFGWLRI